MSVADARWWLAPENDKHTQLLHVVRQIRQNQEHIKLNDLLNATLYAGRPMAGFGYNGLRRNPTMSGQLSLNVVRNMVGAVASKIAAKNKPAPKFLTEEGNAELREQAEQLENFVGGVFYESGVYAELTECFRDACVYGTGCLKVYEGDGRVDVERVIPWELVVDEGESRCGKPRNLYQRRYMDRLVLEELWAVGDRADEVRAALMARDGGNPDRDDTEYGYQTMADQVLVTEGWHLGETEKKAGRHVIVIDGCTLVDEEWKGSFPFAFLRWTKDVEGFFGVGLAEELRGIQREINKLLQQIQRGHHLITGHWMVQGNSIVTSQINNDLGAIVRHQGPPPSYQAPAIISPEVYNHLGKLYGWAYEIAGISQLNATGQKPAGLDSGEAQRVYNDIQTERFLEVGQAYEEFVVEASRQVIRCAKRIGGAYKVRSIGEGHITKITWSDIDLDEQDYAIRVFPTSLMPSTPAGKVQWAEDRVKAGLIPAEDMLDLLDFPDTKAYAKRKNAARHLVERNLTHMLRTGEAVSPEPFDPHPLALRLANEAYHEARLDGVPEHKLQLLRDYMSVTQSFMKPPPLPPSMQPPQAPAPPMGGPPMPPGPPMGDPNAPPPMAPPMGQAA